MAPQVYFLTNGQTTGFDDCTVNASIVPIETNYGFQDGWITCGSQVEQGVAVWDARTLRGVPRRPLAIAGPPFQLKGAITLAVTGCISA